MLLGSCLTMLAQATSLVVDNQTPGWLSSKINYGDQATVRNLKVTGYINATDLKFITTLINNRNLNGKVDLYDANIVAETSKGKDNCLDAAPPDGREQTLPAITKKLNYLALPETVTDLNRCLQGSTIDTLYFNSKIGYVKQGMFAYGSSKLKLSNLILGENIDSIPDDAFSSLDWGLKSVKCSEKIRYIGDYAFRASGIRKINISELKNLEKIGYFAFNLTNISLDTLVIPTTMEVYYARSFPLKEGMHLFFHKEIEKIADDYLPLKGPYGFSTDKIVLHMKSETPPPLGPKISTNTIVYVPKGTKQSYLNNSSWARGTIIEENPVERLMINEHILKLEKEQTKQLLVSFYPANADDTKVLWNVKDESIALVDNNGAVTAISPGTTWLYATNTPTGVKDSCMVTVIQHVSGISIEPKEVLFSKIGETMQLKAEILPANATDKSVKWTSSNSSVCAVTESGYLIALNDGTAIIVAMTADGSYPATCVVKVDTTTGVESVLLDKGVMKTISGISVNGKVGEPICVINSQGVVVYRGVCSGGEEQITLPKGLYIVTIGDKTMKIVL